MSRGVLTLIVQCSMPTGHWACLEVHRHNGDGKRMKQSICGFSSTPLQKLKKESQTQWQWEEKEECE